MEILGTNKASDISVSGEGNPEYRVCSDMSCANEIQTWGTLTAKVLVNAHNYVQLRLISSSSNSQLSQAQLNVGGIVGTWQVTTLNAPIGPALASWKQITLGVFHTCGLASDGKAFCRGWDSSGQLGEDADGDNLNEDIPVLIDTSALSPGSVFVHLSSGTSFTCGLSSEGKAYCWGSDSNGQLGESADGDNLDENIPVLVETSPLSAGANFVSLTTGAIHACGLSSEGKAYCWGSDSDGQLGENADGDNLDENIPVLVDTSALSVGSNFVALAAGTLHTCGLASDGKAYCWGSDSFGQLGENADGDNLDENIPVLVDTSALSAGSSFVALTAGTYHTCALASDGKAYCWGRDHYGQLGENADGDNLNEDIPVLVDTSALGLGVSFVALVAGSVHTCGLASDGGAYCWGSDIHGRLGENADGDNLDENIPVPIDTSALSPGSSLRFISAGDAHTCGLASDGKAYCWGWDFFGQLGENSDGDNLDENTPSLVDTSALNPDPSFISLTANSTHTCGLSGTGKAYCWGSDDFGQLGEDADGDNLPENIPTLVDTTALNPGSRFILLSAGYSHTCGLDNDGEVYCWGSDSNGQLGEDADGDNLDENIPVLVDTTALSLGTRFVLISAGWHHTCGLASDGKAYCWGDDGLGQLGENADGDNLDEKIPVLVDTSSLSPGASFVSITVGGSHSCGISSDGKAYCWGSDSNGQLGENADGDNLDENIPESIDTTNLSSGARLVSLAAGSNHSCGLSSDAKVYCWGRDNNGQLGEDADGDNLNENIPVLVDTSALSSGSSFVSLAAGSAHTCGLSSDGKAYCWGSDLLGQLGESADGDDFDENIPVAVDLSPLSQQ